jgi:hypothetical protein
VLALLHEISTGWNTEDGGLDDGQLLLPRRPPTVIAGLSRNSALLSPAGQTNLGMFCSEVWALEKRGDGMLRLGCRNRKKKLFAMDFRLAHVADGDEKMKKGKRQYFPISLSEEGGM